MPMASAAAIRSTTSSLLKNFTMVGTYARLVDEPNVCKLSLTIPTTSFRNVSQFASFAGFFPQLFTYFFTTCRLVKKAGVAAAGWNLIWSINLYPIEKWLRQSRE